MDDGHDFHWKDKLHRVCRKCGMTPYEAMGYGDRIMPCRPGARGTGRTTRQMLAAPGRALYVAYGNVHYYRDLARKHGREDLKIISYRAFTIECDAHRYCGLTLPGIVMDHAIGECASLRDYNSCYALYRRLQPYIRTVAPSDEAV